LVNQTPPGNQPPSGGQNSSGGTHSGRSLSSLQKLERLVKNELALALDTVWLTIEQVVHFAELALGIVSPAALEHSIAAEQKAVRADPASHTLLGQAVMGFTELETLRRLTEAVKHFGPGLG
jgi:hypothetical protein